jgi:hypothetical protein
MLNKSTMLNYIQTTSMVYWDLLDRMNHPPMTRPAIVQEKHRAGPSVITQEQHGFDPKRKNRTQKKGWSEQGQHHNCVCIAMSRELVSGLARIYIGVVVVDC